MRRYLSCLLFTLFLLCSQHQLINAITKTELDIAFKLVGAVGTFVPQAKPLVKTAQAIWDNFDKIEGYFDKEGPKKLTDRDVLDDVYDKVKQVDEHVLEVGEQVEESKKDVTQEVVKDHKILLINNQLMEVFSRFTTFLVYRSSNVDNETQTDFYRSLIREASEVLTTPLFKANTLVTERETNIELMELIIDQQQSVALMCKREQSPMHVLYNLYNQITAAELQGMILVRYAYTYLDNGNNDTHKHDGAIAAYDRLVEQRLNNTISTIKQYMSRANREFWTCNAGRLYRKLSPIFYSHFISEEDIGEYTLGTEVNFTESHGVQENCAYYRNQPFADATHTWRYKERVHCDGYVRDCYSHELGSDMKICAAKNNSERKYDKVTIARKVHGKNIECEAYTIPWSNFVDFRYKRETCVCTCDDYFNNTADRYFSLGEVSSDILQNKVITGVRIILKNNVFQFRIQEATMSEFGNINQASVSWKDGSADLTQLDKHKITYENRTVNLDVLDAPANTALTGLRFRNENGVLKFEIRYTPFDFASGQLDKDSKNSKWLSGKGGPRPETQFNTKLPKGNYFKPAPLETSYIKFQPSSLEDDVGQTVVPFVDTEKVVGSPATLLSGAGLIYKGSKVSAGFLSMKLKTYDFHSHLE